MRKRNHSPIVVRLRTKRRIEMNYIHCCFENDVLGSEVRASMEGTLLEISSSFARLVFSSQLLQQHFQQSSLHKPVTVVLGKEEIFGIMRVY